MIADERAPGELRSSDADALGSCGSDVLSMTPSNHARKRLRATSLFGGVCALRSGRPPATPFPHRTPRRCGKARVPASPTPLAAQRCKRGGSVSVIKELVKLDQQPWGGVNQPRPLELRNAVVYDAYGCGASGLNLSAGAAVRSLDREPDCAYSAIWLATD
jgi:hypothetical protein